VEDFSATGKLGFVSMTMDQMKAAIDAGVNVQMQNGASGQAGDRVYVSDLLDAGSRNDSLLGSRSDITLTAGQSKTLGALAVDPLTGQLPLDVGLRVTLTDPAVNGGKAIALDVTVLAADAANNTSLADLAGDVNAAIKAALTAWAGKQVPPLATVPFASHTFVTLGDLYKLDGSVEQQNAVLKFTAPTAAAMTVVGRSLIKDYFTPITFSDSTYGAGTQPTASLTIEGIKVDAGGLNLLPPDANPSIDISLPIIDVWKGVSSLKDAVDVRVTGADVLMGLRKLSWVQLIDGLKMVGNLLGQMDSFAFLNQNIPLIDRSVNDMLDVASALAHALDKLGSNPAQGVTELRKVLSESFGMPIYDAARPDVFGINIDYDAKTNALAITIPYVIKLADQNFLLAMDLEKLGDLIGGDTVKQLMGAATALVDAGGSAKIGLKSSAMLNIALGVDLDSGELFVFDHDNNGTADNYKDDKGTFAQLGLEVDGQDLNFAAGLGPLSLKISNGIASVLARAGLYLNDEAAGSAGHGDGRHYLSSAVAVSVLQQGDSVALQWQEAAANFSITGNTGGAVIKLVPPADDTASTADETYRLKLVVGGSTFYTDSFSRSYDADAMQALLEKALFFGPQAIKGSVSVTAVNPSDLSQGWKVNLGGSALTGKTIAVTAHALKAGEAALGSADTIQWVRVPSGSGGSFTLSVEIAGKTYTTDDITWNASAADVASALNAKLAAVKVGEVAVAVSVAAHNAANLAQGWDVRFAGGLAGKSVAAMTANTAKLTHQG
ncbi:MAG: hypothetical protein ACRC02_00280, partial [Vogesella sp.]|uniref:hypothetical protein n=1 Tax=Vogesella sp. TaxID=1904252 RepID=UPI003F3B782E